MDSAGCTGRQTGFLETVPTQTPKGTLLHQQTSRLSVPFTMKDPKVLFSVLHLQLQICCGISQLRWQGKKKKKGMATV